MPTSSDCPACGADKSYQTLELDRPGAIFCTQCGHVLTEVELSDNGFESWKLSARNPPIFDQTNAADPSFIRYSSKTFENTSKTCRSLSLLASQLNFERKTLLTGYEHIRAFVKECKPYSRIVTATAVAYLLQVQIQKPTTLRECAQLSNVSYSKVGKEFRRLVKVLKPNLPEGFCDPYIDLFKTTSIVYEHLRPGTNRTLPFALRELSQLADQIMQLAKEHWYHIGRLAMPVLLAAIFLASDVLNPHPPKGAQRRKIVAKVATETEVSQSSILNRYNELVKLFRQKAEDLPWYQKGSKSQNFLPLIPDILKFKDIMPSKDSVESTELSDDDGSDIDYCDDGSESTFESAEYAVKSFKEIEASISRYNPPQFVRVEAERQYTNAKIKLAEKYKADSNMSESDDQDLHTIAYLLNRGVRKQQLADMKDYQRNQLEQLLRYREENRALYKKDLDKSLLDADDITAEELEMYIKLSTIRKNDTIDTSTPSI